MKRMTCKELGGACDKVFYAHTFEEIAEQSKKHGLEMFEKGDSEHLAAMEKMRLLYSEPGAMKEWFEGKKRDFDALKEEV